MKRKMTLSEIVRVAYFALSLVAVCVMCEAFPACIIAVANLAVAAKVLRTVNVDEIIDD